MGPQPRHLRPCGREIHARDRRVQDKYSVQCASIHGRQREIPNLASAESEPARCRDFSEPARAESDRCRHTVTGRNNLNHGAGGPRNSYRDEIWALAGSASWHAVHHPTGALASSSHAALCHTAGGRGRRGRRPRRSGQLTMDKLSRKFHKYPNMPSIHNKSADLSTFDVQVRLFNASSARHRYAANAYSLLRPIHGAQGEVTRPLSAHLSFRFKPARPSGTQCACTTCEFHE